MDNKNGKKNSIDCKVKNAVDSKMINTMELQNKKYNGLLSKNYHGLQNVIDYKRKQILGTAKLKKYA